MRRWVPVAVLLTLCVSGFAQSTQPTQPTQTPAQAAPEAVAVPAATPTLAVPYEDHEFEPWVLKLRRAEILAVGAFPLAYLLAGLGYDYTFYLTRGFPQENAPWPVGPGTSQWTVTGQPALVQSKNVILVSTALVVSLLVAGADWLLGL